jgi:hypothetical protein
MQAQTMHNQENPELGKTNGLRKTPFPENEAVLMFEVNLNCRWTLLGSPKAQSTKTLV